jgi:predicted DNA-binding protein
MEEEKINVYARINLETKKQIEEIAKQNKRTLSFMIKLILEEYCENKKKS